MSSSGAKAALEGYRKQALYTLHCILHSDGHDLVFHPEGKEDLAVYQGQHLLRVVQVKAYTDNLTISSFSPKKPQSFFHRIVAELDSDDGLQIEVVSFGPIGIEIQEAWAGKEKHHASVREKLRGHQFSDTQIDRLFHSLQWPKVDEQVLQTQVFDFLRASAVGGDPECAFDLLVQWILSAAERKQTITYLDLITKINAIGRYIDQRSSHHQEWYQSIAPIEDLPPQINCYEQLADEFYKGISSRYAHILAGLDVPRQDKLLAIDHAFSKSTRTVLIHGASGQGKTTLALRYLHDYIPEKWRFTIRYVQDKPRATRIAHALAEHLRVVNAPMFIHIDVSPRDLEWTELVKSLLDEQNIRILITIREEDLARNTSSYAELGFPKTIALDFDQNEAHSIYERLVEQGVATSHLSFDDGWSRFGGNGPLLEFVYFLTQSETLKERLRTQVLRLREEVRAELVSSQEFYFLRICCVATAFEARIDVASLANALQLRDPIRTLQLLEREYLLRPTNDRRYIESLHPIRSGILAHELTDPVFAPWPESARLAINHMPETDLEAFLLYAFSRRRTDIPSLVKIVVQHRPKTWSGVAAIMRSLLWLGVLEYVDANMALIKEAQVIFNHAWYMVLSYDIGGIAPGGDEQLLEGLEIFNPSAVEVARTLRSKQTDKRIVYDRLTKWAATTDFEPRPPENYADWGGFAEVHFWLSHLHIKTSLLQSISTLNLTWPLEHLSLRALGEITLSLSYAPDNTYKEIIEPFQSQIIERFCRETKTVAIEEIDKMTRAHYLVPMELNQRGDKQEKGKESENKLELEAMRILQLLRMIIPNRKAYGVQGYGHNLRISPWPYDPTVKGPVNIDLLLPEWPVRLNAIFHNLGDWRFRPTTWPEYTEAIVVIREQIVTALRALIKALTAYFAGNKPEILRRKLPRDLWDRSDQLVRQHLRLPRTAIDEWGLVSESTGDFSSGTARIPKKEQPISLLLQTYRPLLKANDEYFSSLGNYFTQSVDTLDVNSFLGRAHSKVARDQRQEIAQSLGYKPGTARLSLINLGDYWKALSALQSHFRSLLSRFIEKDRLDMLEAREQKIFPVAWALWYQFVNHPELKWDAADIRSLSAFARAQDTLRQKIIDGLLKLAPMGWRCSIFSETPSWEGQPALWMILDADKPLTLFEAYPQLIQQLEMAFSPMDIGTLEQYVLDHKWPHIVVIPYVNGHYWNNGVWHLHGNLFWGGEQVLTPEKTWLLMLREVDAETLQQLGIKMTPTSAPDTVTPLLQAVSELLVLVDHLADLRKVPDFTNEVGMVILQDYARERATDASEKLNRVISLMQELLDGINRERFESSQYPDEVRSLLVKIWECVFPNDKAEGEFSIDLESCDRWAEKLMESVGLIMVLKLLLMDDSALESNEAIPTS